MYAIAPSCCKSIFSEQRGRQNFAEAELLASGIADCDGTGFSRRE
jgi:hypothetical protein